MASSISGTAAAGFARLTGTDNASLKRVKDLDRLNGNPSYNARLGTVIKDIAESLTALDVAVDATVGIPSAWAAPVATVLLLQGVVAASRADKQARVVENNGQGGRSVYIFDAEEIALGDGTTIITPTDVVEPAAGRWILAQQDAVMAIPVVNKTGGPLAKNKVVYISGWDATAGRHTIALADSTDRTKQASGVVTASIANNANGVIMAGNVTLATSGLDTSLAAVGAPVFYSSVGVFTLTAPSGATPYDHAVARVLTLAASGTLRIGLETPRPAGVATTSVAGLQSAADKSKQNNSRSYLTAQVPPSMLGAGADVSVALGRVGAPSTVTGVHWLIEGAPTVEPAANPDDLVVSLKNGAVTVATKTYVGALTPGAFDALTLSAVAGELDLADGDKLTLEFTQNGACQLAKQVLFQATMIPKA